MRAIISFSPRTWGLAYKDRATFAWLIMRFVTTGQDNWALDLKEWFDVDIKMVDSDDGKTGEGAQEHEGGPPDAFPRV